MRLLQSLTSMIININISQEIFSKMKYTKWILSSAALYCAFSIHPTHASILANSTALNTNVNQQIEYVSADQEHEKAKKFISNLSENGIGFLKDDSLSEDQKQKAFKKLLNNDFDMNTIARFSLGRYWKTANKAQRQEYLKLFKTMILNVYSSRFQEYQGQAINVKNARKEGKRDILVQTVLKQEGSPEIQIDWRVRKKNNNYKVIDIVVEGVSMALTQRSDFSSVIQRGGGDTEALLVHLREN